MNEVQHRLCTYTYHQTGLHELALLEPSRAGVDDYITALDALMNRVIQSGASPAKPLLFMIDIQSGMPPMGYFNERARAAYERSPVRFKTRVAIVHKPGILTTLIQAFISLLPVRNDAVRFFPVSKRDEAIAWLLAGEK